jgi:hypothetical protein
VVELAQDTDRNDETAGESIELHVLPSLVPNTTGLAFMTPTPMQTSDVGHEMPARLFKPLGTDWAAQVPLESLTIDEPPTAVQSLCE